METSESTALEKRVDAPVAPPVRELSVDDVIEQAEKVRAVMQRGMVKDQHYGVIPGCKKPSLLQPGAEKLCLMFRLAPSYTVSKEQDMQAERKWEKKGRNGPYGGVCKGYVCYSVSCALIHGPSGVSMGGGVGVCNNWEPKFISRDPYEAEETILQFARKRALVNAVRTATAASDIFTQDEDLIPPKPRPRPQPAAKEQLADEAGEAFDADAKAHGGDEVVQHAQEVFGTDSAPAGPPDCPECGGEMYDNRKYGGKVAFKCKASNWDKAAKVERGCKGVIWQSEVDAHPEQYPPEDGVPF